TQTHAGNTSAVSDQAAAQPANPGEIQGPSLGEFFEPSAAAQRRWSVAVIVALTLVGGLGAWWLSQPPVVVKDSPAFEKALKLWQPLVLASAPTPRKLKQFMNRLRYAAMRQRVAEPFMTRWDHLDQWVRKVLQAIFSRSEPSKVNSEKTAETPVGP